MKRFSYTMLILIIAAGLAKTDEPNNYDSEAALALKSTVDKLAEYKAAKVLAKETGMPILLWVGYDAPYMRESLQEFHHVTIKHPNDLPGSTLGVRVVYYWPKDGYYYWVQLPAKDCSVTTVREVYREHRTGFTGDGILSRIRARRAAKVAYGGTTTKTTTTYSMPMSTSYQMMPMRSYTPTMMMYGGMMSGCASGNCR